MAGKKNNQQNQFNDDNEEDYISEEEYNNFFERELEKQTNVVVFNQKMEFLNYLRELLHCDHNIISGNEKDIVKARLFETLDQINFEPKNLYKKKLLTEKTINNKK